MKTHKDLDVWKDSVEFVTLIYHLSKKFPKDELYGLVNQIRRAAVSIPSNIAEGAGRRSKKDFIKFLYIALGSLSELETQIIISQNLRFLSESDSEKLLQRMFKIRSQLNGLIKSVSKFESAKEGSH
ncbi:MAG: four helix bundle protein [Calditrichaeota bacterium]|nr:four helix bundle protein [Calditrichota bacterium]